MNVLLSTAYWPNLHYFYYIFNGDKIVIEQHDNYTKQSYRNRTRILTANGSLDLTIPIKKNAHKELVAGLQISYSEPWQTKHWRAITSAYKNSPYFDFFEDDIKKMYTTDYEYLIDYNLEQLKIIFLLLRIKKEIILSTEYIKEPENTIDRREHIHPKKTFSKDGSDNFLLKPYYQTFESKFGFTPNLSILDLLLNKGLDTLHYFPKETLTL